MNGGYRANLKGSAAKLGLRGFKRQNQRSEAAIDFTSSDYNVQASEGSMKKRLAKKSHPDVSCL